MELFKYKTEEEQLKAVKLDGEVIKLIYNPSEEVQLAAVKQAGYSIQYINNLSEKVIRYLIDNHASDKDVMRLLFAKIGREGYDKLSDEDKLKIELGD